MPTNTNHQSEKKKRKDMCNMNNHHQTNTEKKNDVGLNSTLFVRACHPQDCRGCGDPCVGCCCLHCRLSQMLFSIHLFGGGTRRSSDRCCLCEIEVCVDVFISLGRSSLHPVLPFCLVDIVATQLEKSSVQRPRCFWPSLLPVSRNSSSV